MSQDSSHTHARARATV